MILLLFFSIAKLRSDDWNNGPMGQGLTRNGSHRRSSYRYRGPWRGPGPEDDGPSEPTFHFPHSKQFYQQRLRMVEEDGRQRSHSTSPIEYDRPYSPQVDLDQPSRSPSPQQTVNKFTKTIPFLNILSLIQDVAKMEYYGTTQLEQRSRSPSPTQAESSLPLPQQLRRFPSRFFNGAKRRLLPSTPGSMKKKKQPPAHLQLGKVDQSLMINFPLVSHSPTIPTRTGGVINFPKLNASPTHSTYMHSGVMMPETGQFVQTTDEAQLMQLPPPLQPQPGVWISAADGTMQQFTQFDPQQQATMDQFNQQQQQQQQQQPQQQTTSRFAPLGNLLGRAFGRSSSQTRQPQTTTTTVIQQQVQQQPQSIMNTNASGQVISSVPLPNTGSMPTNAVMKRNQFGESQPRSRELPLPPGQAPTPLPQQQPQSGQLYYPTNNSNQPLVGSSTYIHTTLPTWPEESAIQTVTSTTVGSSGSAIVPPSITEMGPIPFHQGSSLTSQESLPSGGTGAGRILPAQPNVGGQPVNSIMMRSMEFPRSAKIARERMKIRSSTWTDETYGPDDGRPVPIGGSRRRQPQVPVLMKRPSSAGVLMTPGQSSQSRSFPFVKYGYGTHPQPRRITPPVPRARRKPAPPMHQHSFHSDGAAEIGKPDDDDDKDWC